MISNSETSNTFINSLKSGNQSNEKAPSLKNIQAQNNFQKEKNKIQSYFFLLLIMSNISCYILTKNAADSSITQSHVSVSPNLANYVYMKIKTQVSPTLEKEVNEFHLLTSNNKIIAKNIIILKEDLNLNEFESENSLKVLVRKEDFPKVYIYEQKYIKIIPSNIDPKDLIKKNIVRNTNEIIF